MKKSEDEVIRARVAREVRAMMRPKFNWRRTLSAAALAALLTALLTLVLVRAFADGSGYASELPAPEYTGRAELLMAQSEPPEQIRTGLGEYQSFEEALAEAAAAVPDELAEHCAHAIWGEAGNVRSTARQAAVLWVALNRAEAWGQTLDEVLVGSQFNGLWQELPAPESFEALARDVLARWALEREGWMNAGRTIPAEFLYFYGDGRENVFTLGMHRGLVWDWSLPDPYNGGAGAEVTFRG